MSIINIPYQNTNTFGIELESKNKTDIKQEKFVFIIDVSGSMGERIRNSKLAKKDYVSKVFKYLFTKLKKEQISSDETTISLVVFNNQVTPIFRDQSLSNIVENPYYFLNPIINRGGTRTDLAFEYIFENFDNSYKFVLITDGECNDPTKSIGLGDSTNGDIYLKNYLTQKMEYLNVNSKPIPQFSIMIIGDGPLEASRYMVEQYNSILSYIGSQTIDIGGNLFFDEARFEHTFKQELIKSISDNSDIKTDIYIKCSDPMFVYNSTISINDFNCEDQLIEANIETNLGASTFGTIRIFISWIKPTPTSQFSISHKDSNGQSHCNVINFDQMVQYDKHNLAHNKLATRFLTTIMNKLSPESDIEEIDRLVDVCNMYPDSVKEKFIDQLNDFKTMNTKERALKLMSSRTDERSRTPPRSVSPVSMREITAIANDVDINGSIRNFSRRNRPIYKRDKTPPRSRSQDFLPEPINLPPQIFPTFSVNNIFESPPISPFETHDSQ